MLRWALRLRIAQLQFKTHVCLDLQDSTSLCLHTHAYPNGCFMDGLEAFAGKLFDSTGCIYLHLSGLIYSRIAQASTCT